MKKVVIVSPYFPPSNLTSGHRARLFAAHLGKFGWRAKILSVKPEYYEEKPDYDLEKLIPAGLEVVRTPAFPVRPIKVVGDISIRAFLWHYRRLCEFAGQKGMDLLYILMPPNYSSLLGPLIYRKFGIPYVIDYIDPWVHSWPGTEKIFSKAWFSYKLSGLLEPIALKNVGFITAVAPGYYEGVFGRYAWLDPVRAMAIPYGGEKADFDYLSGSPRKPFLFSGHEGDFNIVYAGAMLPRAYSTLEALFKAVVLLGKETPSVGDRVKLYFIGTGKNPNDPAGYSVRPVAARHGLADRVIEHPARVSYLDVLNHLRGAHAVLIMGSSEAHYTPSKIFQAILSERPIVALLHKKSTAVEIMDKTKAGIVVSFDEADDADKKTGDIARALRKIVLNGGTGKSVDWEAFREYSAENMAKKLATIFDNVTAKQEIRI
ncbi:MAG: hypothetical protein ABH885_00570 [Candidatus Omnitrophota bacterium]